MSLEDCSRQATRCLKIARKKRILDPPTYRTIAVHAKFKRQPIPARDEEEVSHMSSDTCGMPLLTRHLSHPAVSLLEIHVAPAPISAVRPCDAAGKREEHLKVRGRVSPDLMAIIVDAVSMDAVSKGSQTTARAG